MKEDFFCRHSEIKNILIYMERVARIRGQLNNLSRRITLWMFFCEIFLHILYDTRELKNTRTRDEREKTSRSDLLRLINEASYQISISHITFFT